MKSCSCSEGTATEGRYGELIEDTQLESRQQSSLRVPSPRSTVRGLSERSCGKLRAFCQRRQLVEVERPEHVCTASGCEMRVELGVQEHVLQACLHKFK